MRSEAEWSRSAENPQRRHQAQGWPAWRRRSGEGQWCRAFRHRGQIEEVPLAGTVTTAIPTFLARWRRATSSSVRTAFAHRVLVLRPSPRLSGAGEDLTTNLTNDNAARASPQPGLALRKARAWLAADGDESARPANAAAGGDEGRESLGQLGPVGPAQGYPVLDRLNGEAGARLRGADRRSAYVAPGCGGPSWVVFHFCPFSMPKMVLPRFRSAPAVTLRPGTRDGASRPKDHASG